MGKGWGWGKGGDGERVGMGKGWGWGKGGDGERVGMGKGEKERGLKVQLLIQMWEFHLGRKGGKNHPQKTVSRRIEPPTSVWETTAYSFQHDFFLYGLKKFFYRELKFHFSISGVQH